MQKLFDKSVILAILIVLIISTTGIFDTLNYFIYDNYIVLNQKKTICPEIVIVDIDSKTLKAFAYWPFRRSVYSQILQKVINASPKVIGIDLYFNTTQRNKIEDEKLHSILKTFKNIVISSRFEYRTVNTIKVMVPEDSLFPDITRGHVLLSEKKVIRSFPPFKVIPAFSLQVLKLYYQNKLPIKLKNLLTYQNSHNYSISKDILIDFKRPISQFKHISFIDIYNNKDNLEELKNKIVLIGVSDTNLTPFYSTPFNINNKELSVPSVELQAQIIDSFINYSGLRAIPDVLVFIISAIIASLFYYLSKGKSIFMQGAVFILSMIIVIIIDYVIFKYLNLWFPPVILISILILIFSFYIYSTINKIDRSIVKTIEELNKDENLFLERLPAEVIDKVEFFERLVGTISQDRNIIKSIINGINNGIIVFDKEEKIIWANSLILKLFQNSLVLNNSIRELISEIDFDKAIELVDEKGVFRQ
ncbi:MAG: CHASE2 domain-containing protein, partial [Cyanobacteriota bacterium]